ncbi:hypothetical protein [Pseudomonas phage GP100]|nr:hypothetical protein [Pseudomonas phage GP100]
MYALFLESRAAEEVRQYAQVRPEVVVDDLLKLAYQRAIEEFVLVLADHSLGGAEQQQRFDDWWVDQCLRDDAHKHQDVDRLFCWGNTPEGHEFWETISRRDEGADW